MPTFNQLVRSGRQQVTYKSTAPALQSSCLVLQSVQTSLQSGSGGLVSDLLTAATNQLIKSRHFISPFFGSRLS